MWIICVAGFKRYIDPWFAGLYLKLKIMHHKQLVQLSKFLSYVLRHKPDAIGLTLEEGGWVDVDELIENANRNGKPLSRQILLKIVAEDNKQRYSFNADATKVRANQGHSLDVDLNLPVTLPPEFLYHGTAERNIASIREKGLIKQQRHHVHLSQDRLTAKQVGSRYGKPVVLRILADNMVSNGFVFYKSDNNVWLTDCVPTEFIEFPSK